jgi:hypothetical protein
MNDRSAIELLRKIIDKSKEGIRVRLTDRAFARIAATGLGLMLMASTASAAPKMFQQVPPPARPTYCAPKVIIYVVPARQSRPVIHYGGGFNPYQ